MNRNRFYILIIFLGCLIRPQFVIAQVDFNKTPKETLPVNHDTFQEFFYEALKQKAIENYDRAEEYLNKCIQIDNSIPVLYFELGKIHNTLKNFDKAEKALKTAVEKAPENEWFLDELYGFYASQNDHDKAIKVVKQLVEFHPDYKEDLASLYVKTTKYKLALEVLDELDAAQGVTVNRDILRNRIYKITGRTKDQIKNLENRIDNDPEKESNYLALIYRYSENNEKQKAFETAKELLENKPNSHYAHLALYKFYLEENEIDKAVESMKIVVKSTQVKPEAQMKVLADFVNFVGKNPEYETDLVEATVLVSETKNTKTLIELGHYYLAKGNKEKALTNFEEALKLEPNNFRVIRSTILLYIDLKKYNQANEKATEAIETFPSQPILYLISGVALNQLNLPKKALESLEIGLDYVIENPQMETDFYKQLVIAYTLLNNTSKVKTFSDKLKQIEVKK